MRKLILIILIAVPVLVLGVWGALYYLGHGQGDMLKKWIGDQLQTVAGWYLNPKFAFEKIDYEYPKTVYLTKMSLSDVDPTDATKRVEVMSVEKMTLELGALPKIGQPLLIERIILDRPTIRAIAIEPGGAKFAGLSNFVKSGAAKQAESQPQPPQPPPQAQAQPPGTKLSEVFRIRLLKLIDGKIIYDPRIQGTQPMELNQINTELNVAPSIDGWYEMAASFGRAPLFEVTAKGKLNIDSMATDALDLKLSARLGREYDQYLPPQLQQILKAHEVQGQLDVGITGTVPITNFMESALQAEVKLTDANIALSDYRIPIKSLTLPARLRSRRASTSGMELQALDGSLKIVGFVVLDEAMNGNMQLDIANMVTDHLVRNTPKGNEPPPFAGRVNANVSVVNLPIRAMLANLKSPGAPDLLPDTWGNATVDVDRAILVKIPVIAELGDVLRGAQSMMGGGAQIKPTDKLNLAMDFRKNEVKFSTLNVVGGFYAARGTGTLFLDQRLDFRLNAGPIEKMQDMMGKHIGGAIAAVTDQAIAYRVKGTTQDPQITAEVGGTVGQGIQTVGKGVGEGVQNVGKGIGEGVKGLFGRDKKK